MTIEQLKERIEAQCMKHGFECINITSVPMFNELHFAIHFKNAKPISVLMPSADLILEAVDLECRAIKARQGIASNGID